VSAYEHVRNHLADAPAFDETAYVLTSLKARYRLGILSNADDDFLTACLERNGLQSAFEIVVTSESAGFYKPSEDIFRSFCEAAGVARHEVLYVGDSQSADVLGAKNAGMAVAWVNRDGSPLKQGVPQPDHEIASLRDLLDILS
jgi:2-haloalkanoic acid dehalogenase type II